MKQFLKYGNKLISIFMLLIYQSCIEQYTPVLKSQNVGTLLVVEGQITNETGPFRVRLSESVPLYNEDPNQLYQEHPGYGAFVQIFDDKGNNFILYEETNGWYETGDKNLKAMVGNTYSLSITTPDGMEYESSPVLVTDTPGIKKVHHSESTRNIINGKYVYEEEQVKIFVDSESFDHGIGYLKWEFVETWEFELPSQVKVTHGSGASNRPSTIEAVDIDPEKKYCWATESSTDMLVESTVSSADNNVNNFLLQTVTPPDDRLNKKYSILVKQYALNSELYNYFKKLKDSNENIGGMYDTNPAEIIGNIRCCNGETKVLGYFFASEVETKRIFITHSEHSIPFGSAYLNCSWTTDPLRGLQFYLLAKDKSGNNIYSTNKYCVDCRERGTNKKPDFWE